MSTNIPLDTLSTAEMSPLTQAIRQGHDDIAFLFIEKGISIKSSKEAVVPPLMEASKYSLKIVKKLIEHGADINERVGGNSVLSYAYYSKNFDIVDYLETQHSMKPTQKDLASCVSYSINDSVERLLKQGMTVEKSYLENAINNNNLELVKLLMEYRKWPTDFNLRNDSGTFSTDQTPLRFACFRSQPDIVEYYMKNGADPLHKFNPQNKDEYSVLETAVDSFNDDSYLCLEKILEIHMVSNGKTIDNFDELIGSTSDEKKIDLLGKYKNIQQKHQEAALSNESENLKPNK